MREIFDRFTKGETPYSIAVDLSRRGIKATKGGAWTEATVRRQLRNKHVAGICWHNGQEVAVGKWLSIIPRAQWDFVQELLTFRNAAAQKQRRARKRRVYILRGLVICGNCGTTMAGCSGTVYRCSRANRQDGMKCARTMQAEALEKFVEDAAIRLLSGLAVSPRRTRTAAVEAAEREIAEDEQQVRDLHDMWRNKEITTAEYRKDRREIADRGGDPLLNLAVLRAPGLVPGLAAVAVLMITYGGFLFSFALHLQGGLGNSALRAGLTFAPSAAAFGLCGYFWRRRPGRLHPLLAPAGCLVAVGGYVAVALVLYSGGPGGLSLQLALIVTGASLALGFSPLVTHALVRVPPRQAADASGLLTTTIQLGQTIGVATFGSLFLTLDSGPGPVVSAHALAVTFGWLAVLMVFAVAAGIPLARTVAAARPWVARLRAGR